MKIGKNIYGLFLISNNCYSILHDEGYLGKLKSKLDKIEYINSWMLFGIHDTAILVRSDSRLDPAVNAVGEWVAEFDKEKISIKEHIGSRLNLESSIKCKCKDVADLYGYKYPDKYFRIFEYWVDPLIPIYIDDEKIKSCDGVFLIAYIKFKPTSINTILNDEKSLNLQDIYKSFIDDNTAGIFHGFGLFDVIVIIKRDNYKDIRETMIELRKQDRPSISDTYFLISEPELLDDLGYPSLNCSMMIKIRPDAYNSEIWNGIKELAENIGLDGLCIRKVTDSTMAKCPPYTSFRPGFFDVAIDLRFKNIVDLHTFINILEYMPFVEDTATVISYDTNL